MRKSTLGLSFLLWALLMIPAAHASVAAAGMPPMVGAGVAGTAYSHPGGPIASTIDLRNATLYTIACIDSSILEMTLKIVSALDGQTEAMKVMTQGQVEALRQFLMGTSLAELETELKRKTSTDAQAENSCDARDGAAAYGVGRMAEAELRDFLNQVGAAASDGKLGTTLEVLAANYAVMQDLEGEDPVGQWKFPPTGLIADKDLKKSREMAREIVNPFPTTKLDERLENSASGQEALYAQLVKMSRLAVADDTMNAIITAHSPLLDAGEILKALKLSMGLGSVDLPVNAEGKTSVMAYFDAWSQARFGSANWHQKMTQTTDEIKLLREITYMMAMQVEIDRRSLEMHMRNAHLLASILSLMVGQTHNPPIQVMLDPTRVSGAARQ